MRLNVDPKKLVTQRMANIKVIAVILSFFSAGAESYLHGKLEQFAPLDLFWALANR